MIRARYTLVLLVGMLLSSAACEVDSLPPETDSDIEDPEQELCDWGPCDEPAEEDPREPDELPGGDGVAGEDPCVGDGHCQWRPRGQDTEDPFSEDEISGVLLDEDGALTLNDESEQRFYIWIANTDEGTISKIDTESRVEVGRYRTGPEGVDLQPSRTSVNSNGEVFVGNREGQSLTKIGLAPDCPTQSAEGMPNTSSGPNDVLDWGEEECVLWHVDLSGYGVIRAVAAQDSDEGSYVWVGGWDDTIWKIDGESGDMIFRTESPGQPYGFALDESGNLWIATTSGQELGRLDTTICRDHGSCETEICTNGGDDCVKEVIPTPADGYGITVDQDQRVWLGGDMMRYDPAAPMAERWEHVDLGFPIHGITAGVDGYVYGAAMDEGIIRFDAEDLERSSYISGTRNRSVKGVAIDFHNRLWGINLDHNDAFVVEPGPGLYDGQVIDTVTGLVGPYTYSDMTGSQLRFATDQRGVWRHIFEGCHFSEYYYTEWQTLRFTAQAEGGSELEWRVRAADHHDQLAQADWISLGSVPPLSSPVDLRAKLASRGLARAALLQVEVRLRPERQGNLFFVPRVETLDIVAECPPIVL